MFDEESAKQVAELTQLPFVKPYIAVMPDAHAGKGSCVGTVIPTKGAIIPATVGCDIGCGMISVKTNIKRAKIPMGKSLCWRG